MLSNRKRCKNQSSLHGFFRKLSSKNVKKSAKDYFIYFFTLMLSVCLFYSFNSISTQFASLGLEDPLSYLAFSSTVLTVFSVLVCIIMGALVVYANRFLLRRRKREMGTYAVLGLERRDLNRLLMRETLQIGVLSLLSGIALGIFAAQLLSLATARLIGISLANYHFIISGKAIILSILFFGVLFFFVHLFNVRELKKMTLLEMLHAGKRNETVGEGKSGFSVLLGIISVLFILGGYGIVLVMSEKDTFKALALGGLLLIVGTVCFFRAALTISTGLMKKNKRRYYRGIRIFTTSQFSSRLKTEGSSLAMTAVLLFLSFSLTILGPGLGKFVMNGIENAVPYDGTIFYAPMAGNKEAGDDPLGYLSQSGFHIDEFSDEYADFWTYKSSEATAGFLTGKEGGESDKIPLTVLGLEDYNRLLALQNQPPVQLAEGEYAVSYAFPAMEEVLKAFQQEPQPLKLGDSTLTLAEDGIFHYGWENTNILAEQGTLIVPQSLAESLTPQRWFLNFNFTREGDDLNLKLHDRWVDAGLNGYVMWPREEVLVSLSSDNLLVTYLGIYLGITFLITSGAVLALRQLSQSSDNTERYGILKKLGVSKRDMRRSLRKQLRVYFGLPLVLAVLHSAVTVLAIFRYFEGLQLTVMVSVIGFGALVILSVYGVYFIATYLGSRRILEL